jgi:hypothetical protein
VIFKPEWILEDGQLKWKNHYVNGKVRMCLVILATFLFVELVVLFFSWFQHVRSWICPEAGF